jgi:putative ABC transport system permease protein
LPDAERLMSVQAVPGQNLVQRGPASIPDYMAWSARNRTFEAMGASMGVQQTFTDGGAPERVAGQAVTPSLFGVLKVEPQLGRVFEAGEAQTGSPSPLVILSDRLWHRRFAADPEIVGKQIRMDGRDATVIGVMPKGFWYPNPFSEFWVPLAPTRFQLQGSGRLFAVLGRLKPGITTDQAEADLVPISAGLARDFPQRSGGWTVSVITLREHWYGWVRGPLVTLETAVALVLLIACANVSTLLLARVPARRPEITMRVLLGAGRGRIVRQFMTESLLISLIGGALGVFIAWWGVSSLEGVDPPVGRIAIAGLGLSAGVLPSAAVLAILSSLVFGLLPALVAFSAGSDIRQATVHRRSGKLSSILVSTQIGLALVLLVSAALLTNSFIRLVLDDRGFDPRGIVTFEYRIPLQDYMRNLGSYRGMPAMDIEPPTLALQRVYERLSVLPGIESIAGSSARPVNGILPPMATVHIHEATGSARAERVYYFLVTHNFFETMKTPVLHGRNFDARDTRSTSWVAVINETMARRFWPGQDPIGKHFMVDAAFGERPREVIGVVRDIALRYIRTGPSQPVAYTLYLQQPERFEGFNANMFGQMTFFVRSQEDPSRLAAAARAAVSEIDPRRPISNVQTMAEFVSEGMRSRQYYASAFGVFALIATILAAISVYGVMSSAVSQRTREIGIHMAVGARAADIVKLVGGRALRLVAIGLFFGFIASLVLTRLLEAQLWGITATDLPTFTLVIALLILVSSAASFIPARRAMRIDPTEALRMD